MTNLVQNLEQCWYISPPWGQQIPPLLVSLLERVYVKSAKAFDYCTGVEWSEHGWKYEIFVCNTNITALGSELIGTGSLQPNTKEKPVFRLGELVEFRFHGDDPPVRIVQGIQLINDSWFYSVEWMSPSISEKGDEIFTSRDSIARVTDYDLERVIMTVYTSYYRGEIRGEAISISLYPPKNWKGKHLPLFAPTPELLKWWKASAQDAEAEKDYERRFREILHSRQQLIDLWVRKQQQVSADITLCCFEKSGDFCPMAYRPCGRWSGDRCQSFGVGKLD